MSMPVPHVTVTHAPERAEQALDGTFTLQGLSILLGIVIAIVTIVGTMRKTRRENEADAQARNDRLMAEVTKHNDSFENRLKELEITCRDFMPRREIEGKLEHEKVNRVNGQQGMVDTQREQARVLGDIQREQARFGAQLEASSGAIGKLEATVERFVGHVTEKLEKINDCVTAISRKVA